MLNEVDGVKSRRTDFLSVYSNRLARMLFLEMACGRDHPVLRSEITLVEMARSKLREQMLASSAPSDRVVTVIRTLVRSRLTELVRDEDDLGVLLKKAEGITFDSIMRPSDN